MLSYFKSKQYFCQKKYRGYKPKLSTKFDFKILRNQGNTENNFSIIQILSYKRSKILGYQNKKGLLNINCEKNLESC